MSAIYYVHKNHISHKDIKPENILLEQDKNDKPIVKIIDFGEASKFIKYEKMEKIVGSAM